MPQRMRPKDRNPTVQWVSVTAPGMDIVLAAIACQP
jgi:hypothetical protein